MSALVAALTAGAVVAAVAWSTYVEVRAARSRALHRAELALHRHQLRITLRRTEDLVARAEAATADDSTDAPDCACERCARLTVAVALREHTAPWMVPIVVGDAVPRQLGFAVRWGQG